MQRIFRYLGGKCVKCGLKRGLHVDHINPFEKSFTISPNWARSWSVLEPELKKCQLLCVECHAIKTSSDGKLPSTCQPRGAVHGTVWSYTRYKCRCDSCRTAKSSYEKARKLGVA